MKEDANEVHSVTRLWICQKNFFGRAVREDAAISKTYLQVMLVRMALPWLECRAEWPLVWRSCCQDLHRTRPHHGP